MGIFFKCVGAGVGWAFGGPIGAVLGFGVASLASKLKNNILEEFKENLNKAGQYTRTESGDFEISLLILSAIVIKADGDIDQRELGFVRSYFLQMYGEERSKKAFSLFKEIIKDKSINTQEVCQQMRQQMSRDTRMQLLHYLFSVAQSDGKIVAEELSKIEEISQYLGIHNLDYTSIKAMFYKNTDSDYQVLEINPDASNAELKKAYRDMVKKYHPDKLQHLGEEHLKGAEDKFRAIQEAYDNIQKVRA